jgi:nitrogen fixation NifU-like protein
MNIYQQNILDNYHHPQNSGKPEHYTHSFKLQNLSCGDEVEVFVNLENGIIKDVHHVSEGCAISIASSSILSEELKGKTIDEVAKLTPEYMLELLGIELTTSRLKCAHLPLQAVQKALEAAPQTA